MSRRLTAEDQARLERELGEMSLPVGPHADFVARTKQDILAGLIEDRESNPVAAAFVVAALAAGIAGALLIGLTWLFRRRP